MSAYDCWNEQKERLRKSLAQNQGQRQLSHAVRLAVAQVEQSAMAGQSDDTLRQQMGILFGLCKTCADWLDVTQTATTWTPVSAKQTKRKSGGRLVWTGIGLALQVAAGLYCYGKGWTLGWIAMAAAVVCAVAAVVTRPQTTEPVLEEMQVTVRPDLERLLGVMDALMRAIDRYMNDFAYLNEQVAGSGALNPDGRMAGLMAEMMEALYSCGDEAGSSATEAAIRTLKELGMEAVSYTPQTARLFTVLPSKTETATLSPAILSAKDGHLLRMGTAVVVQKREQELTA